MLVGYGGSAVASNPDELITPHFKRKELACPCCGKMSIQEKALDFIERFRNVLGKKFTPNSAYRCPMHNANVGGRVTSAHLQGLAFDVPCHGTVLRRQMIEAAIKAGVTNIGIYPTYLHLDVMNKIQGPNIYIKGVFEFS